MKKFKQGKLVDATKWKNMDGETRLEKKLNSYLTCNFTMHKEIPSDECLSEAKECIKIVIQEFGTAYENVLKRAKRLREKYKHLKRSKK